MSDVTMASIHELADHSMDNEGPDFDSTRNIEAPIYSAVVQQMRNRQTEQANPLQLSRTPPVKAANLEQVKTTPRSVARRPIKIVAPAEPKNGLSALAAPFVPSGKCITDL